MAARLMQRARHGNAFPFANELAAGTSLRAGSRDE